MRASSTAGPTGRIPSGSDERRKKHRSARQISDHARRSGRRRSYVLAGLSLVLAGILVFRLYTLQIINGESYQEQFQSRIRRTVVIRAKRGTIRDRNGKALAETVSTYNITMNDLTDDSTEDNRLLNDRILRIIDIAEENDDEMVSDFSIQLVGGSYFYKDMGQTAKNRFLADIYGYADPADLPAENLAKTAGDVVADLADRYEIGAAGGSAGEKQRLLQLVIARYNLSLNYYRKYLSTVLARDVSRETVDAINTQFSPAEDGIQIEEELVRRYYDPQFFSNIIGYTGEISTEYLETADGTDAYGHPLYHEGDIVGYTGIEASQEEILRGQSGQNTFNVDNIGRVTDDTVREEDLPADQKSYKPVEGRDVTLTIDRDLQIAAYRIIEKNLRDIILAKLQNSIYDQVISEDDDGSSIMIPISNVYTSCLCNIIDSTHFTSEEASETEREVLTAFESFRRDRSGQIMEEIEYGRSTWDSLGTEMQTYQTLLAEALFDYGIIAGGEAEGGSIAGNEVYQSWNAGTASLHDFVTEAAARGWINTDSRFIPSDLSEYEAVMQFFTQVIGAGDDSYHDLDMRNALYKYLVINQEVSGDQICRILMDQGLVEISDQERESFESGWGEDAFTFMYNRIQEMDLTPAQLHLYPSTASVVVTDPGTGDVLAMASYPGYDANRINDSTYYQQLLDDPANPLLNYATQQLTAPGSTFKMVTATAALGEDVVNLRDTVNCRKKGSFTLVSGDPNPPRCWVYPGKHGKMNLENAIANSCNMFFYEMGYRLGTDGSSTYNSNYGIERLQKYAALYGLDTTSGVEISESEPSLLSSDPIRGAIGQDTNAFSTASLARYVSAVANGGTDYRLTLIDSVETEDGGVREQEAYIENTISLEQDQWEAIHSGMRRVATGYPAFNALWEHPVAGKTGTAQQSGMPDNALFVGYAPYYQADAWNAGEMSGQDRLALAVRIPNGYSSSYATQLASDVIRVFYEPGSLEDIAGSVILNQGTSND